MWLGWRPPTALPHLVHAFVTSGMDYFNSILYGACPVLTSGHCRMYSMQRHDSFCTSVSMTRITATIRDLLHWLPVQQSIEYNMCVLVYKRLHQAAPIYLSELCIPVATFAGRNHLRSAVKVCLVTSYCRTKNYGQRSFSYCGPTIWNLLQLTVRDSSTSLTQFCAQLKT